MSINAKQQIVFKVGKCNPLADFLPTPLPVMLRKILPVQGPDRIFQSLTPLTKKLIQVEKNVIFK